MSSGFLGGIMKNLVENNNKHQRGGGRIYIPERKEVAQNRKPYLTRLVNAAAADPWRER